MHDLHSVGTLDLLQARASQARRLDGFLTFVVERSGTWRYGFSENVAPKNRSDS